MTTKRVFLATLSTLILFFTSCSSGEKDAFVIKKGEIYEFFTIDKGQRVIINGEILSLEVKGGGIVVGKSGKVRSMHIFADATSGLNPSQPDMPVTITIEAIYKAIGEIKNLGGAKIYWTAYEQVEALAILQKPGIVNSGLIFAKDLSISPLEGGDQEAALTVGSPTDHGYNSSEYDGYLIDGKGYTITGHSERNILVIRPNGVVIRDITILQTSEMKSDKPSTGITFYRAQDGVLERVTLKNCGRAGVVMAASTATATNLNISRSVWGSVNVSLGSNTIDEQAPGFKLVSGKLDDNFQIYVDLDSFPSGAPEPMYKVEVPNGWQEKLISKKILDEDGSLIRIQNMNTYFPKGQEPLLNEEEKV